MHERYLSQTDQYFKAFQEQWHFIQTYQLDRQYHGVYQLIGEEGTAVVPTKGSIWKPAYHDGRAMLNVSERLRKLAESGPTN